MAIDNMFKFRVDDNLRERAALRAQKEGVTLSALLRQWLEDYADAGTTSGKRSKVRLSAAEREVVRQAVENNMPHPDLLITDIVNAINVAR